MERKLIRVEPVDYTGIVFFGDCSGIFTDLLDYIETKITVSQSKQGLTLYANGELLYNPTKFDREDRYKCTSAKEFLDIAKEHLLGGTSKEDLRDIIVPRGAVLYRKNPTYRPWEKDVPWTVVKDYRVGDEFIYVYNQEALAGYPLDYQFHGGGMLYDGFKPYTTVEPSKEVVQDTQSQGGLKYDAGKLRFSLLMRSLWLPLKSIVAVLSYGEQKYAADSWQTVPNARVRYEDAMDRHLNAWRSGENYDAESGCHHLAHAGCNILFLLWSAFDDQRQNLGAKFAEQVMTKFNKVDKNVSGTRSRDGEL